MSDGVLAALITGAISLIGIIVMAQYYKGNGEK